MIKYPLLPGKVFSKTDGQLHYVRYRELLECYKINPAEATRVDLGDVGKLRQLEEAGILYINSRPYR